tara:strand:- start:491 stop:1021 length:531 start_codon:yes stop_codon:yes gene_type:complete
MFAEKVYYRIDWDRIPVENILDKMVPMSDNLKRSSYRKYVLDYKTEVNFLKNWYVYQFSYKKLRGYLKEIADDIGETFQPFIRFYYLPAGETISLHRDEKTKCGVNFVKQRDFSPITVDGVAYPHGAFLFDGQKLHGVDKCEEDRFTLQVGFSQPYEEVKWDLKDNGLLTEGYKQI